MSYAQTPLEKRRIALFNYLIVFCVCTSLVLGVITFSFGLIVQPILCLAASIILSLSLLFNKSGKIQFSKGYFIFAGVAMITSAVLIYVDEGIYADAENMLFPAMAIAMFLVDGVKKHFAY